PCKWDFHNSLLNRHYSIVDRIITWSDGREVRFELAIDITERKRAEEALTETKRLLSESQQIGKVGGWEFNIDTLEQKWTEETFRIHEVDLTYDNTVEKGINFYTPDSKPIIENAVQRAIEFGEPYDLELKIITAKGNLRHVHTIGKIDLENHRLFGFFQDITARKIDEEEIKHQLSEKETLLKEVHHRIKNSVSQIEGLLRLQANSTDNPDVKTALHDATSRVQGIRVLYEKLLIGKDYQDISVKDYIESLIDSLLGVFQESKNITIEKKITDFNMSSKKVIPVGIIINELLTNIFKYAFKGENNNRIFIELDTTDTNVILTIQDNGIGIDKHVFENKSPGFGLTIVKMLAEQLNGTYTIENHNGTKSVLKFEI
ncbi:MAG TPA: histidine kinase dimerization/phosphoacceptor domain -containing protein, partial [Spirochaetota bacterium]|nr:histidine kinase dimerization/phosphoacceptor domain -containing protein [Spirochaetota bacterium]